MPEPVGRFESDRHTWSERARLGGLGAVLSVGSSERTNLLLHSVGIWAARSALRVCKRSEGAKPFMVDFGCGTGRFVRFFASRGYAVLGVDVTQEMLAEAERLGIPEGADLQPTDGIGIPAETNSVDIIWICGVLKYSLFPPGSPCRGGSGAVAEGDGFIPVCKDIAREMYRVLKPGGVVVNLEMFVDVPADVFTKDFEETGFVTKEIRVLRRSGGWIERMCQWRSWVRLPPPLVICAGMLGAAGRYWFDDVRRPTPGFQDYLFTWMKPRQDTQ